MTKYLIDNWRDVPKMLSAWVAFVCIAFSELLTQSQQLEVLKLLHIPEDKLLGVVGALFLVTRVLKQFRKPTLAPAPKPE